MRCTNCGKELIENNKYCSECLEFLAATGKLGYADVWKYKTSRGGCIGCRYILGENDKCSNCVRTHTYTVPFDDNYEKVLI